MVSSSVCLRLVLLVCAPDWGEEKEIPFQFARAALDRASWEAGHLPLLVLQLERVCSLLSIPHALVGDSALFFNV
jgi:hypothetical protein